MAQLSRLVEYPGSSERQAAPLHLNHGQLMEDKPPRLTDVRLVAGASYPAGERRRGDYGVQGRAAARENPRLTSRLPRETTNLPGLLGYLAGSNKLCHQGALPHMTDLLSASVHISVGSGQLIVIFRHCNAHPSTTFMKVI
ncbi:hypothetical protein Bbelb_191510 [Branchiostoma belcheri]|nr:hypothetical protein Bbelb_191510 [Branchiostoma belcheri]